MSIGEDLKELAGPKRRHDISLALVVVAFTVVAMSLYGRLEAAEKKVELAVTMQSQVQTLTTNQAIMKQQLADVDGNVGRLVSAFLGPQAVIHHPDPRPKKLPPQ